MPTRSSIWIVLLASLRSTLLSARRSHRLDGNLQLREMVPYDLQRLHKVAPWLSITLRENREHACFIQHYRPLM